MSDLLRRNNDFFLSNGDFAIADRDTEALQRLIERLQSFQGEWFLDAEGIPYLGAVLGQKSRLSEIRSLLLAAAAATPGIASIERFDITIDTETRRASIDIIALGVTGNLLRANVTPGVPSEDVPPAVTAGALLDLLSSPIRDSLNSPLRDAS